jgi:hypothetical protein
MQAARYGVAAPMIALSAGEFASIQTGIGGVPIGTANHHAAGVLDIGIAGAGFARTARAAALVTAATTALIAAATATLVAATRIIRRTAAGIIRRTTALITAAATACAAFQTGGSAASAEQQRENGYGGDQSKDIAPPAALFKRSVHVYLLLSW